MKQFEVIKLNKPKKAVHDLSHERKSSIRIGELTPVFMKEVLPGEKVNLNAEMLLRVMPLLAPMMHRVNVYIHFFNVPLRIIWDDFESFITGGVDGTANPNHPKFTGTNAEFLSDIQGWDKSAEGCLADNLGVPIQQYPSNSNPATPLSQLPFRAYQKIYNDYYRDQSLVTEIPVPTDSTNLVVTSSEAHELLKIRKRAYEKDYFTSCLETAQRGPTVYMPLSGEAPLAGTPYFASQVGPLGAEETVIGADGNNGALAVAGDAYNKMHFYEGGQDSAYADLSEATSASIFDLRKTFALQRFMEKMARGGSRFVEYLLHMFGVSHSNKALQRAQFIGGGKLPIQISEVLQTSKTGTGLDVLGQLAGHGVSGGNISGFSQYFEEHGFVIGILSIVPRTGYMQGLPRLFNKFDRFDYYTPDFAHIGEQPVYNREIYFAGATENEAEFGYQPRYSEYRYQHDIVTGAFRNSLDYWHMAFKWDSAPSLSQDFIECDADDEHNTRPFAVSGISGFEQFIAQLYFKVTSISPVPKFGNPI